MSPPPSPMFFLYVDSSSGLYHFLSFWRTSFSLSSKASLLATNSPPSFLWGSISLSLWKHNFAVYRTPGWWSFFFQHFNHFTPLSSCWHGFWQEVPCNSYPCFSVGKLFFITGFQDFLFVSGFLHFEYDVPRCLFFFFFGGIFLLHFLWASWICGLRSVTPFEKFSVIVTYKMYSAPFSLSSSSDSLITHMLYLS